ncbi:MAG: Cation efflux system protein CusA, partial [Planctomycetota bacterium]
ALAETVDPQLRTILAESPSSIAAAELHQLFLAELTRRKRIKAVPHARSHAVTLEQRLAQARQKIVASHRRTLDQELLTRARETLGRVAMEEVLAHGPPPNDDELRREFGRLRAFRLAPPQPQRSGHHGLANYEPAAFDPLPRFDALHAEFTRPIASDLSLRRKRREELVGFDGELDRAVPMPGWTNVWTMPIQNRVDMLATGVNTTVGIRVLGTQLDDVVATSQAIAETLRDVPGAVDVIADPIRGKGYLDIRVNAQAAERARLPRSVVHHAIEASMGGTVAATIVMHRQRVPIRVTLAMGDRSDPDNILHVPVAAAGFVSMADHEDTVPTWVTLGDVADVKLAEGPATIKSEKGLLRNYVRFNIRGREVLSMVAEAQQRVAERVPLPEGVFLEWTGQYEHQARARRTLWIVAPLVLLSIFGILWATYRDLMDALLIVPAVLGALAGGLVAQVLLGDRLSITVAIGYVACFGMAASTGIIMLVYLREAVERAGGLSALTLDQLRQAVLDGATQRLRPKILTEATTILGLAPMLWATGTGSEVIRPMTAPVLGGILIADEVIDLLVPVLFYAVRKYRWQRLRKPATTS